MSFYKELNSLVKKKDFVTELDAPKSKSAINQSRVTSEPETLSTLESGGIASPLTEQSRLTQKVKVYNPNDASQWVEVEQTTQITFSDADGRTFVFNLNP